MKNLTKIILKATALLLSTCLWATTPPPQPNSGPANGNYNHAGYSKAQYGSGNNTYWVYQPASPTPASAPVMLYLHGWAEFNPNLYEDMLIHFARSGVSVIFPRYGSLFGINAYQSNAINAFNNGLAVLQNQVTPQLNKVIFAGHSLGGILSLRLANVASSNSYPAPKAIVVHDMAGYDTPAYPVMPIADLSGIANDTALVMVSAPDWETDANRYPLIEMAWNNTPQLSNATKNLIVVRSDNYGTPDLVSDHLGVQAGSTWFNNRPLNAIDWWGYWRPTQAAVNWVIDGSDGNYVFGDGSDVTDAGQWSDGTPAQSKLTASDFNL